MKNKNKYAPMVKPQYLTFLLMLYVTASLIGCAVLFKTIKLGFIAAPGGILCVPFVLLIEDIIAEVYGYEISRTILWYILISQLIFTYVVTMIIHMNSPSSWHMEHAFIEVFGGLTKGITVMVIAVLLGRFTNLFVITKTKIYCKGKWFWPRSVFSSLCGDLVGLSVFFPIAFSSLPFFSMMHMYLSDLFVRVVYSVIGGGPAWLLVMFVKKREGLDVYDYHTNFNPFKLSFGRLYNKNKVETEPEVV